MEELFAVWIGKTQDGAKITWKSPGQHLEAVLSVDPAYPTKREIVLAFDYAVIKIREAMCPHLAEFLDDYVRKHLKEKSDKGIQDKRVLAGSIGMTTRRFGVNFVNPENGEPCNLMVINDLWGGKYAYENRKTKKRSHTTRDITKLLPFKFTPTLYSGELD